jgi:hypothetical protein
MTLEEQYLDLYEKITAMLDLAEMRPADAGLAGCARELGASRDAYTRALEAAGK